MKKQELYNLIEIENDMDKINGEFGYQARLCIFCGSSIWDGKEGIVHKEKCPIKLSRNMIKVNGGSPKL